MLALEPWLVAHFPEGCMNGGRIRYGDLSRAGGPKFCYVKPTEKSGNWHFLLVSHCREP